MSLRRPFGPAPRGSALGDRPRPFRRRCRVSCTCCTCAWCARRMRMAAFARSTRMPALALPGVVAVWTFADVADIPPIDFRLTRHRGPGALSAAILAQQRVRYVGDPVAVVFADRSLPRGRRRRFGRGRDRGAAGHSRRKRRRPASSRTAARPSPRSWRNPTAMSLRRSAKPMPWSSLTLAVGRHSGVPMETRGAIARYDAGSDVLEMHGAAKVPHWNRDNIARMLGRDPSTVHLYEGHVGGGFGIRGELYPEDVLVCAAALRLGRPVKWIEDRREHLIAANHSRQQRHSSRAAVDADGRILGSTTNSSTTRAAMCAPMRPRCPTLRRRCCPVPTASPRSSCVPPPFPGTDGTRNDRLDPCRSPS